MSQEWGEKNQTNQKHPQKPQLLALSQYVIIDVWTHLQDEPEQPRPLRSSDRDQAFKAEGFLLQVKE